MSLGDFFRQTSNTEEDQGQWVGPLAGVPVPELKVLAPAAYGSEALLTVLLPLGAAGVNHTSALTLMIVVLLAIVTVSYRQTIEAI